jgi:hypothetical protein
VARKPAEIYAFPLRIRESLRRKLEAAAEKNRMSLNIEIANRLARSFEADNVRALEEIVADLDGIRRGFAALRQTADLVAALRNKIVPLSASEPEVRRLVEQMDAFLYSVYDEGAQPSQSAEIEPTKHERKRA